jgi:hypothetical protein
MLRQTICDADRHRRAQQPSKSREMMAPAYYCEAGNVAGLATPKRVAATDGFENRSNREASGCGDEATKFIRPDARLSGAPDSLSFAGVAAHPAAMQAGKSPPALHVSVTRSG